MTSEIVTRTCSLKDCDEPLFAKTYCSKHYSRNRRHGDPLGGTPARHTDVPIVDRFWSYVAVTNSRNDCWEWQRFIMSSGYGQLGWNGRLYLAHRMAWMLTYGEDDTSLFILHSCDNRKCVNPYHLRKGTVQDNSLDCVQRNRQARGAKLPHTKLTDAQVEDIKKRFVARHSVTAIAKEFGVGASTICHIKKGRTWTHI